MGKLKFINSLLRRKKDSNIIILTIIYVRDFFF